MIYTRTADEWVRNTDGEVASFEATGRALMESTTPAEALLAIDPDATLARRDVYGNLSADAYDTGYTVTPTAGGVTQLTVDSTEYQEFTGTTTQVVRMPTGADVKQGHRHTIINSSTGGVTAQSSNAGTLIFIQATHAWTFVAKVANPTTTAHWQMMFQLPITLSSAATGSTIPQRNSAGDIAANAILLNGTSTVSSAGTTVISVSAPKKQIVTGATTHTFTLPSAVYSIYQDWEFINLSTGAVTINSSGGNLVKTLAAGASTVVTALTATPTTAAHWYAS